MKIGSKLKLAHFAMACLAVLLTVSFIALEKELERDFEIIHEQSGSVHMALMTLRFTGLRAISASNEAVLLSTLHDETTDPQEHRNVDRVRSQSLDRTIEEIQKANSLLRSTLTIYANLVSTHFPDDGGTLRSVEDATSRLMAASGDAVEQARRGANISAVFTSLENIGALESDYMDVLNAALEKKRQDTVAQLSHIETNFMHGEFTVMIGGILVVLMVIAIGAKVSKAIAGPVQNLASAVDRIGHGEFDVELEMQTRDEIGHLATAVGAMAQKLKTMTSNLEAEVAERRRAEYDLKQSTQAAELLRRIAFAANHADSPDHAIKASLDEVCAYSGWPIGHAYMLSEDGSHKLVSANIWHLDDPERMKDFRRETDNMVFRPGVGLPGKVVSQAKTLWLANVEPSKNYRRAEIGTASGIQSGFAIPVMVGRQVAAVLEFFTYEELDEDEQLLQMAEQVGVLVGRVIERRRNEQSLLDSKKGAEAASRSKSEFIANMSHELRTPLNAINGFSELLADEAFGPLGNAEYQKFAKHINSSGQHLLALINDILDISKIEAGSAELNEETFDVVPLIDDCITMLSERAAEKGVKLVVDIADTALPLLHADKTRLKQMVLNLLTNAVKFTRPGGRVILKAWHNDNRGYVLQVSDTGIGIAAADIPKALTRFQQVDGGLDREQEGTGLGLPLVKSLVEQHGGSLELQSELGVGTTVTLYLPASRMKMAAA